jgi:hypothetical protein
MFFFANYAPLHSEAIAKKAFSPTRADFMAITALSRFRIVKCGSTLPVLAPM